MLVFTRDSLPKDGWHNYKKKPLTQAVRIKEPFTTQTKEGPLLCLDGYLAVDNRGNPYPIDREVFETTYEEINI